MCSHSLGYHTDNIEYMEEGKPHMHFEKRVTVRTS